MSTIKTILGFPKKHRQEVVDLISSQSINDIRKEKSRIMTKLNLIREFESKKDSFKPKQFKELMKSFELSKEEKELVELFKLNQNDNSDKQS